MNKYIILHTLDAGKNIPEGCYSPKPVKLLAPGLQVFGACPVQIRRPVFNVALCKIFCFLMLLYVNADRTFAVSDTANCRLSAGIVTGTDIGGAVPFPLKHIPKPFNAYPQILPNMGAHFTISFIKNWNLVAGLNYKTVGMKADARVTNQKFKMEEGDMYFTGTSEMDMKFTMLEIPLYVKYQFGKGKIKHFVTAGIYYSYVFKGFFEANPQKGYAGASPDVADLTDMSSIRMNFTPFLDNWDTGYLLGYGRRVFDRLSMGLVFSMGLKDILKPSSDYFDYNMLHMRGTITLEYILLHTKPLFGKDRKSRFD
jgi:hypothetical protein